MPTPKPISLSQIASDDYTGKEEPQEFVVVGPIPGGGGGGGSTAWADITGKPTTFTPAAHNQAISTITGLQLILDGKADSAEAEAALNALSDVVATKASAEDLNNTFGIAVAAIPSSQKAAANGVATLGADSKLPAAQLPAIAITEYLQPSSSQAAMLAKDGQQGDWTIRTDLGTVWVITGANPTQLASWTELGYPTAPVTTVAGRTGVIVLTKTDVGLGNVDNTSDANKPVSAAQQAALTAKLDVSASAALNTVGWDRAVYIAKGGTVPAGTPAFTVVRELE
jgi:hypothetical protein